MSDDFTSDTWMNESGEGTAYARPLVVDLDGYEGPLDVLLALARTQKVDITRISTLALAEQFLEFIAEARRLSLEVAADYLVMAAWLAYLKSKLLLPEVDDGDEPSGPELAARLTWQLKRLEAFREAGARLMERNRLGRDIFARGQPEGIRVIRKSTYEVSLFELLRAYVIQKESKGEAEISLPVRRQIFSVEAAMARLTEMLGQVPSWEHLETFLPPELRFGLGAKSAMASTLSASLELAKSGKLSLRQGETFGPIYIRPSSRADDDDVIAQISQDNRDPAGQKDDNQE